MKRFWEVAEAVGALVLLCGSIILTAWFGGHGRWMECGIWLLCAFGISDAIDKKYGRKDEAHPPSAG